MTLQLTVLVNVYTIAILCNSLYVRAQRRAVDCIYTLDSGKVTILLFLMQDTYYLIPY